MSRVSQIVTEKIIKALSEGVVPWRQPWKAQAPRNGISGRRYTGVNRILLELEPWASPDWFTFRQIQAADGRVKKGAKSALVIYYGTHKKEEEETYYKFLRYYLLFNREQTEGLPAEPAEVQEPLALEAIKEGYLNGPAYEGSPTKAYYSPATDTIRLPAAGSFTSPEAYARTLFHEMIHSTGHPKRLNRFTSMEIEEYSKEELIAEIGAAILMAEAKLSNNVESSAGYIASWLKVLQNDSNFVVSAASAAEKAVNHILGRR